MSTKDEFIEDICKEFCKRQRSPNLIKDYFYQKERWSKLQEEARNFGLYFWIHINFNAHSRSILRIGDIEERQRSLFDNSTDKDSECEEFSDNLVSSKELEYRTVPYLPGNSDIEDSSDNKVSWVSFSSNLFEDQNDSSVSTPSTTHSVQFSEETYNYLRASHLGVLPEFPIEILDSSDDDSCMES